MAVGRVLDGARRFLFFASGRSEILGIGGKVNSADVKCERHRRAPFLFISGQGREIFDRLRKALDQANKGRGLGIRRCPSLFPVFQGSGIGAQIHGEHRAGEVELFADGDQFLGGDGHQFWQMNLVRSQRDLALALIGEGIEAIHQFGKNVTFHSGISF